MKPRHCENITWDDLSWRSDGSVTILPLNKRIRVSVDVLIAKLLITAAHGSHHTHFVINTPKYSLEMKILTNTVETLEPNNDNFAWQITEKFDIPGSRGDANFVKKCKVCGKVGTIDIVDGSISAYDAELGKAWQKVVMFECRGVKPVDFEPGGGWIVTAMSGARYENVDLSEKMGGGKQQIVELFVATAHNSEIPCDRSNVETAVQRFWIVDFDPVMNKARHYDISCNSSGMHVAVHMERPFTGTVHLADRFSQCRKVVESADSFAMFFPNSEANVGCNIKEKDNRLTATLIFSNQQANLPRNAIFGNDAVDEVQCMLESTSAESNNNNSKMIYTHTGLTVIEQATAAGDGDGGSGTSIVQESTVHRQAHLEILRDSSPVKQVYIGETLLLSIWADYDAEGIFVENCSVTDAQLEQPLLPLIINGCCEYCTVVCFIVENFYEISFYRCSVEPSIIGHFHHVPDRLQASFQAFKMADAEQLYFQCVIKFCNDWCPQVECDNGNNAVVVTRSATRLRRIVNGIEQKSQNAVYSSVETLISILPKESSTTPSQQLIGLTSEMLNDSEAQSWKFATSVVLLFALSLLVVSFIVLLAYWQWKRRLANAQ
ncbi:UPF0587 protein F46B6.12 [Trichinella spiralis]|uniref:UPF0587 protein F46B6.12 n=1 Tax=Trichinella spiralis TaxID=6334 RepID=A0A0V1AWQ1_TRISP|nr:UPF0587 protein F46B6.12 [Trichinella spiralis]